MEKIILNSMKVKSIFRTNNKLDIPNDLPVVFLQTSSLITPVGCNSAPSKLCVRNKYQIIYSNGQLRGIFMEIYLGRVTAQLC